ncbi:MAG: DUF4159 domain-containing protein [Bacteroidota bacterium]|nr:DUF4159 domain-containing protein [Bacteroidota bacterium]MDE2957454.1 DUF4159 domain-containing protein [Bacteroidota bacterium]
MQRAWVFGAVYCCWALPLLPYGAWAQDAGFQFVRIWYESHPGMRGSAWATDYPTAELNLHEAIDRTTGLALELAPIVLPLTDERIFDYAVLYLTEPGYWRTNEAEVKSLRRYLDRGGFLIIDDFHDYGRGHVGPQWNNMYDNIKRVLPDREPFELTADHPIWSIYYDIDPDAAISTKNGGGRWWGGMRFAPDDDIYYGIADDNGHLMVVICYNQDIGDGWEWPGGRNLGSASTVSFQMAINFIYYALTH